MDRRASDERQKVKQRKGKKMNHPKGRPKRKAALWFNRSGIRGNVSFYQ